MAIKLNAKRLTISLGVLTSLVVQMNSISLNVASADNSPSLKKEINPSFKLSESEKSGTVYSELSLSSWQNSLNLNSTATPATTQLYADPIGLCPGVGYRSPFSDGFDWDVNACVFVGRADVSVSSNAVTTSAFSAKNVFVLGMQSQVGLLWTPAGQTFQFGLGVPLLLSHASWPNADEGQTISSNTQVHSGVLIESRFYSKNKFCVDPKIEWLQTDRSMLWSLNFTFDL